MYKYKDLYTIDFTDVNYYLEMHAVIWKALDFPDYYGCNWDAFWDCITDFIDSRGLDIEIIGLDKIYNEYSKYIDVIAIHEARGYENNPEGVKQFIETQFEGFTIKFGYDESLDKTYTDTYYQKLGGTGAYPMTVIVNEEGVITKVVHGSMTEDELREEIRKELSE